MWDGFLCLFWGIGLQTAGTACILTSARNVPVIELSLIMLVESAAAPIWAWLFIGEHPTLISILGGTMTLIVVAAWLSALMIRSRRRLGDHGPAE
jgi:drug/metabolite transporter (DMT)-like permease